MIKSLTLLLTILFSTGLSAQEINKKYHHHEFGGSLSVGSNPADNTVRDIRAVLRQISSDESRRVL